MAVVRYSSGLSESWTRTEAAQSYLGFSTIDTHTHTGTSSTVQQSTLEGERGGAGLRRKKKKKSGQNSSCTTENVVYSSTGTFTIYYYQNTLTYWLLHTEHSPWRYGRKVPATFYSLTRLTNSRMMRIRPFSDGFIVIHISNSQSQWNLFSSTHRPICNLDDEIQLGMRAFPFYPFSNRKSPFKTIKKKQIR